MAESSLRLTINAKDNSEAALRGLNDNIEETSGSVAVLGGAFLALGVAIVGVTKGFFDFERSIAEIATLVDSSAQSNEQLSATVKELSDEFGQAATDVAAGLYQAISAGAEAGTEANELLRQALILAQGSLTSTETAVDGLTTVLNSFASQGLKAERASDILFATVRAGKTNMDQLAASLALVTPIAGSVGVSFEELAAAIATLTLGGTRTAQATTQIRAAIAGILRPTEELREAFEAAGFASAQAALEQAGLAAAFTVVADASGGNIGELQKLVGSIEGVNAILGTTGTQAKVFEKTLEGIAASTGAAQAAAVKVAATFQFKFTQAVIQLGNAFTSLGEALAPIVVIFVQALAAFVVPIGNFIQDNLTLITTLSSLLGVLLTAVAAFSAWRLAVSASTAGIGLLRKGIARFGIDSLLSIKKVTAATSDLGGAFGGTTEKMSAMRTIGNGISSLFGKLVIAFKAMGVAIAGAGRAFLAFATTMKGFLLLSAGVVVAAGLIAFNMRQTRIEVDKLADSFDDLSQQVIDFANKNPSRSVEALAGATEDLTDATEKEIQLLAKEIELRKILITIQIKAQEKLLETQITAGDTTAIETTIKVLESLNERLEKTEKILGKTKTALEAFQNQAIPAAKAVEEIKNTFEETGDSVEQFIENLERLNDVELSGLEQTINRQINAKRQLLEAGGADDSLLLQQQLEGSAQLIAIAEERARREIAIEQERFRRRADLARETIEDEQDLARELQVIGVQSVSRQIEIATSLAATRREQIAQTQQALTDLTASVLESRQKFENAIEALDNRIATISLRGLSDAAKREKLRVEITKKRIEAQQALEEGRIGDSEKIVGQIDRLIGARDFIPKTQGGLDLLSQAEVSKSTTKDLEKNKLLREQIFEANKAQTIQAKEIGEQSLRSQRAELESVEVVLERLAGAGAKITLASNASEVVSAFALVESTLQSLDDREVLINIVPANEQSQQLADIFGTQTFTISTEFTGFEKLTAVAAEFEQVNTRILADVTTALAQIKAIAGVTPQEGFAGGGFVRGKGSGTSDSIFARLSSGEFVMKASAVKKYGAGFFSMLNSLRGKVPRFADGGLVGQVGTTGRDTVDINLKLGGEIFRLQGERESARNMVKAFKRLSTGVAGG